MATRATARRDEAGTRFLTTRQETSPGLMSATSGRRSEAGFVGLAIAHAVALVFVPSIPLIALALWWNANTIAHNFIHRPFFMRPGANRLFAVLLTLELGFPHDLWRQRHLRHHVQLRLSASARPRRSPPLTPGGRRRADAAGGPPRPIAMTPQLMAESALVCALWTAMAVLIPQGFLFVYLPGWALGLGLCQLQGHFEHASGTTSHYGRIYNLIFFNDGYHVEHHQRPGMHWSQLPALADPARKGSRWPAVLRFLERRPGSTLESLERLVLRAPWLQRFVIDRHTRAFRRLLPSLGPVARITIIGGGLFPRTALILRSLLPHAAITIVDASESNLQTAQDRLPADIRCVRAVHVAGTPVDADLVIVPLAFQGDRRRFYLEPPAARVIVHDWIWRTHPSRFTPSARVSWLLLKRLNLVQRCESPR
ncbi:MAG TPA: fatty acid desaturase [Vicinamibacterales bacterium]|nr:fatty acid desaturase [Vicinamibacterales bacterium]